MKLRYKKLVIIITVITLGLGFFILTLIPTGGSAPNAAEEAELKLNENPDINKLISDYYAAKKTVNIEAMSSLVSAPDQINKEKFTAMAEYVEDYQNFNCYVIEDEQSHGYCVFVKYDTKLKNISTLAPCFAFYYVTTTSEGNYIIYLSALDEAQVDFINSAKNNSEVVKLKEEVKQKTQELINSDLSFKQFYQKIDSQNKSATASGAAAQ